MCASAALQPEFLDSVKGFLDPEEGRALYTLAREAAGLGPCLEVGSYCGKSTVWLGTACRERGRALFSIDHHRGSEEQQPGEAYFDPALFDYRAFCVDTFGAFRQTLKRAGLEETVVPLVCSSAVAAREWTTPLGLVFIDGGHSAQAAQTDYRCWSGHVVPDGYLLIHDIFTDPAQGGQAPHDIYRRALASGRFKALPMVGTLGVLRRR